MERKIVVQQKIVDDHYVDVFVWEVVDDSGVVYARGEGKKMLDCMEEGRKHLHRKRPIKDQE